MEEREFRGWLVIPATLILLRGSGGETCSRQKRGGRRMVERPPIMEGTRAGDRRNGKWPPPGG